MAKLIYASNMSLDGWTEDADGGFSWAPPDDDVFAAITEVMASAGTYLYGRRMYEVLAPWETEPSLAEQSELRAGYARVWQAADKVVYSTTLHDASTARTRIEPRFDADAVRAMKESATADLMIGGAALAGQAFAAGLVDECRLFVHPAVVGGGKAAFAVDTPAGLELLDERRFANGIVFLRHRVRT